MKKFNHNIFWDGISISFFAALTSRCRMLSLIEYVISFKELYTLRFELEFIEHVISFKELYTLRFELEFFSSHSYKWPLRWTIPRHNLMLVAADLHHATYLIDFHNFDQPNCVNELFWSRNSNNRVCHNFLVSNEFGYWLF